MFITKYEQKYLNGVLGYAFSKLFTDGLAADPVEDRWTKLKEGDSYVDANGVTQQWTGFITIDEANPIVNYVYYWFTRDNASKTTPTGEREDEENGAVNVSGASKQSRGWNEMVQLNCALHDFLLNKKDVNGILVYPEFTTDCRLDTDLFHPINIYNL
ncbi:hypothetical protein JST56_07235 [Candidatus Dependentiae bacterium]|nr:hypothetical protein [Candidatus Dependentiae bacterium]